LAVRAEPGGRRLRRADPVSTNATIYEPDPCQPQPDHGTSRIYQTFPRWTFAANASVLCNDLLQHNASKRERSTIEECPLFIRRVKK
jgi:hypothetical protein